MNNKDGTSGVYLYDFARDNSQKRIFNVAVLLKLRNVVLAGDTAVVGQLFGEIIQFVKKFELDEQECLQIFFSVRQIISNTYRELLGNTLNLDLKLPEYSPTCSIIEVLTELSEFTLKVCDIVNKNNRSSNEQLKAAIIEYITTNYSDKGLNASSIAENMLISEKYVFSLIKEHTGKSLGRYIEDIRLSKAEELLLTTSYSNKKISEMVGFGGENTFYISVQNANRCNRQNTHILAKITTTAHKMGGRFDK